jgi:hypothetical protein
MAPENSQISAGDKLLRQVRDYFQQISEIYLGALLDQYRKDLQGLV